jgi:hypothetical protein
VKKQVVGSSNRPFALSVARKGGVEALHATSTLWLTPRRSVRTDFWLSSPDTPFALSVAREPECRLFAPRRLSIVAESKHAQRERGFASAC